MRMLSDAILSSARFYRSLQAYRESFAEKNDVMVVDPSADFFRYFKSEKAQ